MAHAGHPLEAWHHMPALHRASSRAASHQDRRDGHDRRRDVLRLLIITMAVAGLLLTSSALNLVTEVRAADAPKAVIVSGPVHSLTQRYKAYARDIADAAEAKGMDVTRIFHPTATVDRVKKHANGAKLFVYVGHGNGWPSAFGPFQEDTKNGLGLNPADPDKRTTSNVIYKGANWLKANVEFAPNAVVILSHLSYASGNASSGMPIPSRSVAVERVDNFANGFLASGAQVVFALGWQPGADIVRALADEAATMDAIFMTRYRDGVNPLNGWIGHDPGYYPSVRTPGAVVHIDPDPTYGYLRGLTGNLEFTTNQWRDDEALPPDTEAPVLSDVAASQAPVTVATTNDSVPVFTPNGDGLSDTIKVSPRLSENAFLDVQVRRDGDVVRRMTVWSLAGKGATTWDGRRDDGAYVGEGQFRIVLTPMDRAGNQGEPADVRVLVLSSIKSPTAIPALFHARDGDELAQSARLRARLTRPGTVSWLIRDDSGTVVRHGLDGVEMEPGLARFTWDGSDDAGQLVPDGRYTARVRVTRPQGTYAHDVTVRVMPFKLWTKRWILRRGDTAALLFESAEPIKGRPILTVKQRAVPQYEVGVKKLSPTDMKATLRTRRAGKPGPMTIRITGTDSAGGSDTKSFTIRLK
jgi:flagellar hook assembly protein FlgD